MNYTDLKEEVLTSIKNVYSAEEMLGVLAKSIAKTKTLLQELENND